MSHKLALDERVGYFTADCSCGWIGITFTGDDSEEAMTAAIENGTDHLCDVS